MSFLSRLILLILLTAFVVQPAMACWMNVDTSKLAPVAERPPCHEIASPANVELNNSSHQILESIPCILCGDCDNSARLIKPADDEQLPNTSSDDYPAAAFFAGFSQVERTLIVRILGPPEESRLEHATPITLKQRLLV